MDKTILAAVITGAAVVIGALIQRGSRRGQRHSASNPVEPLVLSASSADAHAPAPKRTAEAGSCEKALRQHPLVKPRLNHKRDQHAAEAAVAYFTRGVESPVESWKRSSTWRQIKAAYDELTKG